MIRSEWSIRVGALLLIAASWIFIGWQAALLLVSVGTFVLLLQFSRTLRLLRDAGHAPVGHVGSAVMLHARLRKGMRLPAILRLTRSLGEAVKLADASAKGPVFESFRWRDEGDVSVEVELVDGRCQRWTLTRPTEAADAAGERPADRAS